MRSLSTELRASIRVDLSCSQLPIDPAIYSRLAPALSFVILPESLARLGQFRRRAMDGLMAIAAMVVKASSQMSTARVEQRDLSLVLFLVCLALHE